MSYDVPHTMRAAALLSGAASVAMQDFSRLVHLCHFALETQRVVGAIVEFGCFRGDTAKLLSFITDKEVHLYDSFMGLPENDERCTPGAMSTSVVSVIDNFKSHGIRSPSIHAGWFQDVAEDDLPECIAFAHLDGDLYTSTLQALGLVYWKMSRCGVILVDDYEEPYFPGVKRACDEFFAEKPEKMIPLAGMNGLKSYKAYATKL